MQNACYFSEMTKVCICLPCGKSLQLVVCKMQDSQVWVPDQDRHTLICQKVVGQIEQLQGTQALLPCRSRWQGLQTICGCIQVPEADRAHTHHFLHSYLLPSVENIMPSQQGTLPLHALKLMTNETSSRQFSLIDSNKQSSFYSTHASQTDRKSFRLGSSPGLLQWPEVYLSFIFTVFMSPRKSAVKYHVHKYSNCEDTLQKKFLSDFNVIFIQPSPL